MQMGGTWGGIKGSHAHLAFNSVQVQTRSKVLFLFFPQNQIGLCSLPRSREDKINILGHDPAALGQLGSILAALTDKALMGSMYKCP